MKRRSDGGCRHPAAQMGHRQLTCWVNSLGERSAALRSAPWYPASFSQATAMVQDGGERIAPPEAWLRKGGGTAMKTLPQASQVDEAVHGRGSPSLRHFGASLEAAQLLARVTGPAGRRSGQNFGLPCAKDPGRRITSPHGLVTDTTKAAGVAQRFVTEFAAPVCHASTVKRGGGSTKVSAIRIGWPCIAREALCRRVRPAKAQPQHERECESSPRRTRASVRIPRVVGDEVKAAKHCCSGSHPIQAVAGKHDVSLSQTPASTRPTRSPASAHGPSTAPVAHGFVADQRALLRKAQIVVARSISAGSGQRARVSRRRPPRGRVSDRASACMPSGNQLEVEIRLRYGVDATLCPIL